MMMRAPESPSQVLRAGHDSGDTGTSKVAEWVSPLDAETCDLFMKPSVPSRCHLSRCR